MENLETTDQLLSKELVHSWKDELENLSKSELLQKIVQWKLEEDYAESSSFLKEIRHAFDLLSEQERAIALQKYIDTGGEESDFDYKDPIAVSFDNTYSALKEKLGSHYKEQERNRLRNLQTKENLLEQLRQLLASEEGTTSLDAFKKIQADWKATGPVPGKNAQELHANYHALLEIFYNNRAIYFELKDLDRKKNSQLKQELCDKIEALLNHADAFEALRELKKLQEEYREIGPAVKEDSESIHARYRSLIDQLLKKKDAFIEVLKHKREENLVLKKALIAKLEAYKTFSTTKIDEWKEKTTEILKLQEEWKKLGAVSQEIGKELNNEFWSLSKLFFQNKNEFFKALDDKRKENLHKKIQLCEKAEALKNSDNFQATSKELILLQKEWTKIGQVPIKHKDSIYKRFKEACDHFFNRQRESVVSAEKGLEENLHKKNLYHLSIAEAKDVTVDNLKEKFNTWIREWNEIGQVPRAKVIEVQNEFTASLHKVLNALEGLNQDLKDEWALRLDVLQAKGGGDSKGKVEKIEKDLLRQINTLKTEIERYKTNIDFWGKSKNADKIKEEIQSKILEAEAELKKLNKKVKILRD